MKEWINKYVFSWDFIVGVLSIIFVLLFFPEKLSNNFLLSCYSIGINVLAIVFSVFFAAFAIIIASPDDDFAKFLEQNGGYTKIVGNYRVTVWLLFIGLVVSILAYINMSFIIEQKNVLINISYKFIFCPFVFIFSYALCATAMATEDALQYVKRRMAYLRRPQTPPSQQPPQPNP